MAAAAGILILLFSLVALGTWPALLDLSYLRGRHAAHAYLDYSLTVLAVATVLAAASRQPLIVDGLLISGSLAAGGGLLLMLGNLSMQRALIMGVPLAIVLPLQGSLTVVLGTSLNYLLQPERSDAPTLGVGVCAFACLTLVFVYFYIGTHICTVESLATYHQSFWTQMDAVNGIAWVASGRRALTERASHELDALMRVLPEDVRRVVGGETEEEK